MPRLSRLLCPTHSLLAVCAVAAALAARPAQAVQVQCTDSSTTFLYGPADFKVLAGGVARDGGVGSRIEGGFDKGCILRLKQPAKLSGAGHVRIEVQQRTTWDGIVDPAQEATGPNRNLFHVESMIGADYQIEAYRLGETLQTVRWTDESGRYAVDARSKPAPIVTPAYAEAAAVDKIDVLICELAGGIDVVVHQILVETDLVEPELCNAN